MFKPSHIFSALKRQKLIRSRDIWFLALGFCLTALGVITVGIFAGWYEPFCASSDGSAGVCAREWIGALSGWAALVIGGATLLLLKKQIMVQEIGKHIDRAQASIDNLQSLNTTLDRLNKLSGKPQNNMTKLDLEEISGLFFQIQLVFETEAKLLQTMTRQPYDKCSDAIRASKEGNIKCGLRSQPAIDSAQRAMPDSKNGEIARMYLNSDTIEVIETAFSDLTTDWKTKRSELVDWMFKNTMP